MISEEEKMGAAMQHPSKTGRPRVVIVGAGFGGLTAAQALDGKDVDVLVLDRNNYHGFWPLLYQVATAGLEPQSVGYPVRSILRRNPHADFAVVEVTGVDYANKQVVAADARFDYDYLIIAAGSANNYFGNDSLATETIGLKDLPDAVALRDMILNNFEAAVRESDPAIRRKLMTLVIIGGGPTGVELAGAFSELITHVLNKDYPMLDVAEARVQLIEGSPHVLAAFPESLQKNAKKRLEKKGVHIMTSSMVTKVEDGHVVLKDGTTYDAGTVVWAAGVAGSALGKTLGVELKRGSHVPITPTLNLADHPDVFVIGDMSYLPTFHGEKPYPGVAQVAMQQGKQAAKNIVAAIKGKPMQEFHYTDKGNLATIGRSDAVMDAFGLRLTGFVAWVGWLLIHIVYLIGFRNRIVVLANWAYNYLTYDRGARIVIRRRT